MVSKPIINLLKEFDEIIKQLSNDKDCNNQLNKIEGELKILELSRKEIELKKQSIFIIGKTSTGKSTLHNLLLDTDIKKEFIFKESTKVETSVIQTLQHCSKENAFAEIQIKDYQEFEKLKISDEIKVQQSKNSIIIHLTSEKEISFLRDQIMAKSDDKNAYNPQKALDIINIHYPLKYFRNFIIIDTPGLGSHESTPDSMVRNYFQGKSHVLWLLNTSTRTLSDSISLLKEEEELLNQSLDKIIFIGNQFDQLTINNEDVTPDNLKEELTIMLNLELKKIKKDLKNAQNLIFTSFKKPDKKFGKTTTHDEFKKLEEIFQIESKQVNLNNIDSITSMLIKVLIVTKDRILSNKKEIISEQIKKQNIEILKLQNYIKEINNNISIIKESSTKSQNDIKTIEKKDSLNTHEKYNIYLEKFKQNIKVIEHRFISLIRAKFDSIDTAKSKHKIKDFGILKDFALQGKESLWNKYINDSALDSKKKSLSLYVDEKTKQVTEIENEIFNNITLHFKIKNKEISNGKDRIDTLNKESILINNQLIHINQLIENISNVNRLLLEDVESKIANWSSIDITKKNYNILESFLQLNYLLDEHDTIINRIKK